jgi:hypothetical protein
MDDLKKISPCVMCGYCCLKAACSYGEEKDSKCRFLIEDDKKIGTYKCLIYKEIKEIEKDSKYPMFDCGCSSSLFNNVREDVIKKSNKFLGKEKNEKIR